MENINILSRAACELAAKVPYETLLAVAAILSQLHARAATSSDVANVEGLSTPESRRAFENFQKVWKASSPTVSPREAACLLLGAAEATKSARSSSAVEVVWTGPGGAVGGFRETEQAILEVLDSASRSLLLASYTVFRIPAISAALVNAAKRGVEVTVIVEHPAKEAKSPRYDPVEALGPEVARRCSVYYWSDKSRPVTEHGKQGIMHVKCAIADRNKLFLSSANLTDNAFTVNMELGLLLSGGALPGGLREHFESMIRRGELELRR